MSDDLIRRQDAIDSMNGNISVTGMDNAKAVQEYIRSVSLKIHDLPSAQPTIDAVEVVHCRDCKYYDVNLADGTTCFCTRLELFNEHDWFCADGERRE